MTVRMFSLGRRPSGMSVIACAAATVLTSIGCSMERVPRSNEPAEHLSNAPIKWPETWAPAAGDEDVLVAFSEVNGEPMLPLLSVRRLTPCPYGLMGYQSFGLFNGCNSALHGSSPSGEAVDFHAWRKAFPPASPPKLRPRPTFGPVEFDTVDKHEILAARFETLRAPQSAVVGTAVILGPLGGASYIRKVTNELAARGWMCVKATTMIWSSHPLNLTDSESEMAFDPDCDPLPVVPGKAAWSCAGTLESIGMMAFGYQEAVEQLWKADPSLVSKPLIVVGFSMGAIQAPTVAARLPRVDGAVLVGGGANLLGILAADGIPGLARNLIRDEHGMYRTLSPEQADQLSEEYLRDATLDPYNTAPLLKDKPVLMLHARYDGRVPARYGDLLWERLGKPERWIVNYGHDLLFFFLDDHAVEIADWVDTHVILEKTRTTAQSPTAVLNR